MKSEKILNWILNLFGTQFWQLKTFWQTIANIDRDLDELIKSCDSCLKLIIRRHTSALLFSVKISWKHGKSSLINLRFGFKMFATFFPTQFAALVSSVGAMHQDPIKCNRIVPYFFEKVSNDLYDKTLFNTKYHNWLNGLSKENKTKNSLRVDFSNSWLD